MGMACDEDVDAEFPLKHCQRLGITPRHHLRSVELSSVQPNPGQLARHAMRVRVRVAWPMQD